MTFRYTDPHGYTIQAEPHTSNPVVTLTAINHYGDEVPVDIPLDRIAELIAGLRDTARQAATGAAA